MRVPFCRQPATRCLATAQLSRTMFRQLIAARVPPPAASGAVAAGTPVPTAASSFAPVQAPADSASRDRPSQQYQAALEVMALDPQAPAASGSATLHIN